MKVSVVYNSILPVYKQTFDLCELLQNTKKSCPVPKGIFDITVDTKVSEDVPAVSIGKKGFLILNNSLASFLYFMLIQTVNLTKVTVLT